MPVRQGPRTPEEFAECGYEYASGANYSGMVFDGKRLRHATFDHCRFVKTTFSDCDLLDAVFTGWDMEEVRFINCKLAVVRFAPGCRNIAKMRFSPECPAKVGEACLFEDEPGLFLFEDELCIRVLRGSGRVEEREWWGKYTDMKALR